MTKIRDTESVETLKHKPHIKLTEEDLFVIFQGLIKQQTADWKQRLAKWPAALCCRQCQRQ